MNKNIDAKSLVIGALLALLGMLMMGSTTNQGGQWTTSIATLPDGRLAAMASDGNRLYFQSHTYELKTEKWIDVTPGESKQGGFR